VTLSSRGNDGCTGHVASHYNAHLASSIAFHHLPLILSLLYSAQSMDQAYPGASTNRKARRVQQGRASQSVSGRPDQSEHSAQWRQPPTVRYGEDQSGASWHPQVSFQEPLSYGHSPSSFSSGSTSSVEQSALGEPLQELAAPPLTPFTPHDLTRDISPKLTASGFRLKAHSTLNFCKTTHSQVLIYGLKTMVTIFRIHLWAKQWYRTLQVQHRLS
jgi:hypothetical protein